MTMILDMTWHSSDTPTETGCHGWTYTLTDPAGDIVATFENVGATVPNEWARSRGYAIRSFSGYHRDVPVVTDWVTGSFVGKCGPYGTGEFYSGVKPGMRGTISRSLYERTGYASWAFSVGGAWLSCTPDEVRIDQPFPVR